MEFIREKVNGIMDLALESARAAVQVGKQKFSVFGVDFDVVRVTPTEHWIQRDGADAGIRVYGIGSRARARLV